MPKGIYDRSKRRVEECFSGDGYITIRVPEHPRAHKNCRVFKHILVAEEVLGKPLPKGVVVHHHGAKDDNTQLVICQNHAYHMLLHQRMRALRACGHANWRKCVFCGQYDKPVNLCIRGSYVYHRICKLGYMVDYRKAKKEQKCLKNTTR